MSAASSLAREAERQRLINEENARREQEEARSFPPGFMYADDHPERASIQRPFQLSNNFINLQ